MALGWPPPAITPLQAVRRGAGRNSEGYPLSTTGFILTTLVCCAFGAAAVFGYVALSAPTEPSEAIIAATGPRALERLENMPDDGTWTEEDIAHCRSEAAAAGEAAAGRRLLAVSNDRVGLGGPSDSVIERSTHLLCTATRKPTHLCKRYWGNQLIEAIKAYAKDFRDVASRAYWNQHEIAEQARRAGGTRQAEWESAAGDLRQTTQELARLDEEIVAALRGLVADGIVDPDAFGVFFGLGIPPDIARMIGGARPLRDRCG